MGGRKGGKEEGREGINESSGFHIFILIFNFFNFFRRAKGQMSSKLSKLKSPMYGGCDDFAHLCLNGSTRTY